MRHYSSSGKEIPGKQQQQEEEDGVPKTSESGDRVGINDAKGGIIGKGVPIERRGEMITNPGSKNAPSRTNESPDSSSSSSSSSDSDSDAENKKKQKDKKSKDKTTMPGKGRQEEATQKVLPFAGGEEAAPATPTPSLTQRQQQQVREKAADASINGKSSSKKKSESGCTTTTDEDEDDRLLGGGTAGVNDEILAYLRQPKKVRFGVAKVLLTIIGGIYAGAFLAKFGANLLEEYEIFVKDDDDDD